MPTAAQWRWAVAAAIRAAEVWPIEENEEARIHYAPIAADAGAGPSHSSVSAKIQYGLLPADSDDDGEDMGRALYLQARDALQVAVREEPGTDSHSEGLMEAEGLVEQARAAGYELTHIDRIMAEIDREKQRTA